jgi:hypothetical protein
MFYNCLPSFLPSLPLFAGHKFLVDKKYDLEKSIGHGAYGQVGRQRGRKEDRQRDRERKVEGERQRGQQKERKGQRRNKVKNAE